MLKPEVVCGDPGRLMFFEHVGHYFAAEPKLKPLPIGTPRARSAATLLRASGILTPARRNALRKIP
jgi:hypothetical protein